MTRSSVRGRLAKLFYYLEEARQRWDGEYILAGALLRPRESALLVRC